MDDREVLLRQIAELVAQRDFFRDVDHKQNLLDCIAKLLANYGDKVDVM